MKYVISLLFVVAVLSACNTGPRPIVFGEDSCAHCRMVLMDPKFGIEMVTPKGKTFFFDDVNCVVAYESTGQWDPADGSQLYFVDFSKPGELIPLDQCHFVQSETIKAPMASQVAVFGSSKVSEEYREKWNGKTINWQEIREKFAR
jgi:copper chaperone NosL